MLTIPINQDNSPEAVLDILFKLKVKDVMSKPVLTAGPEERLRHLQGLMKKNKITGIPIVDSQSRLLGIISMDDIVTALDNGWIDAPAEQHMSTDLIVLQDTMNISFCVSYFNKYSFGRYPVLNNESKLVGIVTASDVISTLLVALNKEVERLEQHFDASIATKEEGAEQGDSKIISTKDASPCLDNCIEGSSEAQCFEFKTESFNFEIAGQPSTEIKRILKNRGVDPSISRRVGIASYELEINQVVHSVGGVMRYILTDEILIIEAKDLGPGIPDVKKALTEGFSTATEKVRSFGFGAGMGLPNTKRVSDDFTIESSVETGTIVRAIFNLSIKEGKNENK